VPYLASLCSAYGLLISDLRQERVTTMIAPLADETTGAALARFRELDEAARQDLGGSSGRQGATTTRWLADMRYVGQAYEIQVPFAPPLLAEGRAAPIRHLFEAEHARAYGPSDGKAPAELVNLRAIAQCPPSDLGRPRFRFAKPAEPRAAPKQQRSVYFPELE